ncbi:DUF1501 domain-containing protein [Akkermansiaceae bacterium]|nr:DUF1501 domain-containing protein [bacterium]MDA7629617.1 DUF1501 domain-containing protein [Akkermansiaceae bacterium]MDB4273259.1 DUF1501 domain-containing protein [Akkermansiaceae bacterium]MDB4283689.1 DUF1501 domain-containing protein [Akkermansiaceae bacterium]MDB4615127.1 DUF1501 domain-containing protein [Akkermansiaceae bacterium]
MADVLQVTFIILGFYVTTVAYWVAARGLVPKAVERCATRYGETPWRCLIVGQLMEKVTVVVVTEFGRRVAENSSFGTDHGSGGAMFVMGGGEEGKVGTMPELEAGILIGPGDVPVTTDYRSILGPVLKAHGAGKSMREIFLGFGMS